MHIKNNNKRNVLIALALVLMLTLSACGGADANATPTLSVDAIFTAAFQTLSAQQATQLALTPPTATPSPSPSPTLAPPPTQSTGLLFGSPTTSSGGAQTCDNAVYVKDVTIPDKTVMDPGKKFVKTWALQNNGTCAWSSGYKLTFISGEQMEGASSAIVNSVPSGSQVEISVNLTAPDKAGDFTGWWRMQNDKGQYFGNSVSVVIKVSGAASVTDTPSGPTNTPVTPSTSP